ncbi:glycerophosphoinositol permease [Exophiala xenobiotica]|nr:glycerophosphoinositol permease [Exophiala xenobiotica]KAK5247052.1 glycerophosphoinositol permease [Exophiala xenobiotica]KAK5346142.1 glycerophosphoinositol permease [Exophiala xenobiotica]KAK5359765.1 glycerophosphoinositol permease [Exophiala xenobiotica]KAK5365336.1 glycerophosphoinositol permease [Exophiala xenobiotica]
MENEKTIAEGYAPEQDRGVSIHAAPLDATPKTRWERSWPTIACGAGLFSDGYLNGDEYSNSSAQSNVTSIAFAGTVVGQLAFGYLSDHWSRRHSLLLSTIILIIFAALGAGSYGAGGSVGGLFAALTAYRFLLGIGIGGEYPAGSVACAEATGELKRGHRNRWFICFTNLAIDVGFVVASLVPMIMVLIFSENHLRAAWRMCLGLGVIPPLSLLYLRIKLQEPEEYNRNKMNHYPYWLILKFYWFRLSVVALIWFIYDFSSYSFGIYSSSWLAFLLPATAPLWKTFGWNTVINLFYCPGAVAGAFLSDLIGAKYCLVLGVWLQGIVGFIMTALYGHLDHPGQVGGFVVVYGIFLALGEVGPGDNIGLLASKTSATSVRGMYYGIAAACGKIGAFVGNYVFPSIIKAAGDNVIKQGQYPFYVSSALCIFSGLIALVFLPNVGQDTITEEDERFRAYLIEHGYDVSTMGTKKFHEEKALANSA